MDRNILRGLILVSMLLVVVTGVMIHYLQNPNTPEVNNIINTVNQTRNNNSDISPSKNLLTSNPLQYNGQPIPGPSPSPSPPGPAPDPMKHIIKEFDDYVKSIFPQTGVTSAAVVIVQNNKILSLNCFGVKDIESGDPVDQNTLFKIGSATKQFTSTSIAQLVSEGLMSWDDPITEYYPKTEEFQLYDDYVTGNITIRDCLTHQSGLIGYSGDMNWMLFNFTYPYCLHQLRYIENSTQFRDSFQYHNILYSLPAYCAERATNTTWSDLVKNKLLNPLGMKTTTLTEDDFKNSPNHAKPYVLLSNGTLKEYDPPFDAIGPAGVMACSISEMVNWLKFQIADTGRYNGKQILSKKELDETRTFQNNVTSLPWSLIGSKYGFGWFIGNESIYHPGDTIAFNSMVRIYPSDGLGIAILADGKYAASFRYAVDDKFSDLLKGDDTTDPWFDKWKPNPPVPPTPPSPYIPPLPLNTYTGVYYNAFFGNINITTDNNTLNCYYGNNNRPFELKHWNSNEFHEPTGLVSYTLTFNFTEISNNKTQKLTVTGIADFSTKPISNSVYKRINST